MRRQLTWSNGLISFVALFTAISPFLADFNTSHVYNPYWPGHARFHNGQTVTTGLLAGLFSLYFLWVKPTGTALENLKVGSLFAAFYWLAMAPAILYPGTTLADPALGGQPTDYVLGFAFTQLHLDALLFGLLLLSYRAEAKCLQRPLTRTLPLKSTQGLEGRKAADETARACGDSLGRQISNSWQQNSMPPGASVAWPHAALLYSERSIRGLSLPVRSSGCFGFLGVDHQPQLALHLALLAA